MHLLCNFFSLLHVISCIHKLTNNKCTALLLVTISMKIQCTILYLVQKHMYCIKNSLIYVNLMRKQCEDELFFCTRAHTRYCLLRTWCSQMYSVVEIVGDGLPTSLHTMAGVVFVTKETIRFLATFLSSLADSKIKSNDGIPAVE